MLKLILADSERLVGSEMQSLTRGAGETQFPMQGEGEMLCLMLGAGSVMLKLMQIREAETGTLKQTREAGSKLPRPMRGADDRRHQ